APFGIWLPRNSADQALMGKSISLEKLSKNEKQQIIAKQGMPWITLLKMPGHIVLYIGEKNQRLFIFHDFWGIHTKSIFQHSGRAIVGKTAITPIDFGKEYSNVPRTFIDSITNMVFLTE